MIQKHKCGRNSLLCTLKMITAAVIITNHCLSSVWLAIICCQQELEAMGGGSPASSLHFYIFCFSIMNHNTGRSLRYIMLNAPAGTGQSAYCFYPSNGVMNLCLVWVIDWLIDWWIPCWISQHTCVALSKIVAKRNGELAWRFFILKIVVWCKLYYLLILCRKMIFFLVIAWNNKQ